MTGFNPITMLPRKRGVLLLTLLAVIRSSEQYGSGAPSLACADQLPRHSTIVPQTSVPPYVITTSAAQVRQGDTLDVTIASPTGAPVPIGGFILQARQVQNPDTIVGRFATVSDTVNTRMATCTTDNDTATHSNPDDKPAVTFQWVAPTDFLGSIEFRATVAQSYATFWRNVESPLVEVVTPDTVIASTAAPVTSQPGTTAPPVVAQSTPAPQPVENLDPIYQGCGETKLCFGVPQNCIPQGNCLAIVAVLVAGEVYTFELQGTGNPRYVATALSFDNRMGDDSAMECVQEDNGIVNLFTSWTYPRAEPYVSRADSPQNIVQLLDFNVINGKLYCRFTRDVVSTVQGQTFDLANGMFNLMAVSGDSMRDEQRVDFHNLAYEATGSALSLAAVGTAAGASRVLVKLHGSCMLIAWLATSSVGIMLARYFRQVWVGRQLGGKDVWFASHRALMALTWLLTIVGFVLIFVDVRGWAPAANNPHAITGLVTSLLCFIQPIGAFFRPHPGTKKRPIFNWLHWLAGNGAHILGIATIFLAVYLPRADLPPWSVYILAAFVVFHVIMHVVLTLTVCVADGRISSARVTAFPMKDLQRSRHPERADSGDAPFSSFRRLILGIYAPITVIFTVVMICLVALAPIASTLNSISGGQ